MALNNVRFVLGQGGIGRPLAGEDYISGLLFYTASLPSGFDSSHRVKQFFSVADAEAAGILDDYSDATAATGTYLITNKGAAGDIVKIKVTEPFSVVKQLLGDDGYTVVSGDSTIDLLGASLAAAINALTLVHGYTAAYDAGSDTLTITAPKSMGIFLNSGTPIVVTITGTVAGTLTQFSGGAASKQATWHYHISEYFRMQPQGNLFVGFYAVPSPYTFAEISLMQTYANGKIRQIGVYKDSAAFDSGDITKIHNICNTNVGLHKELIALYAADISGTSDISTMTDLRTLSDNLCSAVISQDGGALGAFLYETKGKSITNLGALLGTVAAAKVSESVAWVSKFNVSDGEENDVLAFANGVLFTNSSVTDTLLANLQNYRYIFLRKFVGIAGSYWNENSTAITTTSDYAYIADNRTIQKATRGIYANLVTDLNSPITLNADGTLSDEAVAYFTSKAEAPLIQMIRDGELSGQQVSISTTQDILSTGILTINVNLVQIATGRNIVVNIGYRVAV